MEKKHSKTPSFEELILTPDQEAVSRLPFEGSLYLDGPAGSGKTTIAICRLDEAVRQGLAEKTLVLVPQRTLGFPYQALIRQADLPPGGRVDILTLGGLAQRAVNTFWPAIAGQAGFSQPDKPPVFLTLESAQYYLARFVDPKLKEGRFDAVTIDRARLLSQILDNLNKSAVVGFPYTEISQKLKSAWTGKDGQVLVYDQAQACAGLFRSFCLEYNLLDFSLQLQTFRDYLWQNELFRAYLHRKYRHLIYDNIEEDFPVAHDLLREWLPEMDSALLIADTGGGFRSFLGADPASAESLASACASRVSFSTSLDENASLSTFRQALESAIHKKQPQKSADILTPAVTINQEKFIPQMVEGVGQEVQRLFTSSDPPPAICIVAPFLSDSLSFSLSNCLTRLGIPHRSHRPSHPLLAEPAVRCLLTLAKLAHPDWDLTVSTYELRSALMQSFENLDLVRADILARAVHPQAGTAALKSFQAVTADDQGRITFKAGADFEILRAWIESYQAKPVAELDIFMSRLFGEVLSQPGFGFHQNFQTASAAAELIESIQKFRSSRIQLEDDPEIPVSLDFIQMLEGGIIAAQYLGSWQPPSPSEVYIAPAFTFLTANFPVDYQIWLDLGSRGWWERLYQPLTHPVVLSRAWVDGSQWTDGFEVEMNRSLLVRLTGGLVRRCRKGICMHALTLNEQGDEQHGALLQAVQFLIRKYPEIIQVGNV
ncbi:MAG: hypothetical protein AB9891_17530 [Anaerolineaceae bacterium]